MEKVVSPREVAAGLAELWSPRIVGEVDDAYVKVAKVHGLVPKGVRHNPVAEDECDVLLIERKSTLHTGDVTTEKTRSIADQLRPT